MNHSTNINTPNDAATKELMTLATLITNPVHQPKKSKGKDEAKEAKPKRDLTIRSDVFQHTKELFPLKSYRNLSFDKSNRENQESWEYVPVKFSQNSEELAKFPVLYHWTESKRKDKIASFVKFNKKIDLMTYTDEEYEKIIKNLDSSWSKLETDYFWQLLEQYDCRFFVIQDKYSFEGSDRTIEDLKERFYTVCKALLEHRNEKNNPLYHFKYDASYERFRKFQLEKYLHRSKDKMEEERKLIEELKQIEQLIKKEEREQHNLQKILDVEIKDDADANNFVPESIDGIFSDQTLTQTSENKSYVILRGSLMNGPIPGINTKINKKMEIILNELGIPEHPMATKIIHELYDELRKGILMMFNLQRHIKKKEEEIRLVEQGQAPPQKFEEALVVSGEKRSSQKEIPILVNDLRKKVKTNI